MNIIELWRINRNSWSNQLDKIISIEKRDTFMKIVFVIMILGLVIGWFDQYSTEKKYYKNQIIGTIEQIEKKTHNWEIKIDSNWYFVQRPGVKMLKVGQKIEKNSDSWVFTVYDSIRNVVYQDSLRNVSFRLRDKHKKREFKK